MQELLTFVAQSLVEHPDQVTVSETEDKDWLNNWKRNKWMSSTKKPVKNKDLWQELDKECQRHITSFVWVKGHNGHTENERCDELARNSALGDNKIVDIGFVS